VAHGGRFELYYLGFGLAIASVSPNELLASLLVPVCFTFAVAFCGVMVPYAGLPTFWRSWMYHVTPFKYLVEAMLGLVVHTVPVKCNDSELAIFSAPDNTTCNAYVKPYVEQAGGYVQTMSDGMCGFCRYANGDEFATGFNIFYKNLWMDYGIFIAYILFNFAVVFFCSWIYLQGGSRIKNALSPTARKERKRRQLEQRIRAGKA